MQFPSSSNDVANKQLSVFIFKIPIDTGIERLYRHVVFLDRKTSLMFANFPFKVSRWHVALSQNKTTLRFSKQTFWSSLHRSSSVFRRLKTAWTFWSPDNSWFKNERTIGSNKVQNNHKLFKFSATFGFLSFLC